MSAPAQQQQKHLDIAIIGGGIAGLTLAIALHRRGVRCTIYEQAHEFGEIGAGVSLSRNAISAMEIIDRSVLDAFNTVVTNNQWKSKKSSWFDFMDGTSRERAQEGAKHVFAINDPGVGQNAVHRAHFLNELVKLVPKDIAQFHKRLNHIQKDEASGKMLMKFEDGTVAEADAVIGCDGIKSRTRAILVGDEHPAAKPTYTHKYAYRGLIPMAEAIKTVGEERAANSSLWMGQNRHVLTFPVDHGATMNLVAFATNERDWPSSTRLTLPTTRAEALDDFRDFGPDVLDLIKLTNENLDKWAIFDTGDHPLSTFYKGRVCVVGDAAHATSPHHGAGAGFCIEDAAVIASLLADEHVRDAKDLEAVFAAFDANRRERTQWLVQSSRRVGNIYEWLAPEAGKDFGKIEKELNERVSYIWDFDLPESIKEAKKDLHRKLAVPGVLREDSQVRPFASESVAEVK